jgi:AcrR family transcriptional regulator
MTRNGSQRNETGKHERAITALVAGATMQAAAAAAGVDRTTLWRWMREDAMFIWAYNQARADQRDAVQAELRSLAADALAVVRGMLQDDEAPPALRLRAAMAVLEVAAADKPGSVDYADVYNDLKRRETLHLLGA